MTEKPERRIDTEEARRILENLARNGPPTAQVAAIKDLREMDKDERAAAAEAQAGRTGFDELDNLYAFRVEPPRKPNAVISVIPPSRRG